MSHATKTLDIAGCTVSLHAGYRYWASRPMADGRTTFKVTILPLGKVPPAVKRRAELATFSLSYEQATAFINAFNCDRANSWNGRVW